MKDPFPTESSSTLLDYDAVMAYAKKICIEEGLDENNHKNISKCLTLFALRSNFETLTVDDAWSCIVDGSNDQGIDAIYIEEDDLGETTVHIFQTKAYTARENILNKAFSGNDLDKLIEKFDDFIVQRKYHNQANENLKTKLKEVYSLQSPKYKIGLITTGLPPIGDARLRFLDKVHSYNKHSDYVGVTFIGLERLSESLPQRSQPRIDMTVRLEGKYVEAKAGMADVLVGRVQGRTVAELVRTHGEKLFQKNVRGFLKLRKDSVNSNIYASATDDDEAPYFFILNNGITIVCDDFKYMSGQESPEVSIVSGQIVNGGQTSNSLYQALYDDKLNPNVNVLVRIIKSDQPDVVDRITKATNRQNAVYDRDLRSNDDIQKIIKSYIYSEYGYYYESRKNENDGRGIALKLRIDAEKAAQAYYSYYEGEPAVAKSGKSKLFNQYYDQIFNAENDQLPKQLFFSQQLLEALESLKGQYIEKYTFTRDAMLTTLALLKEHSTIIDYHTLEDDRKNGYVRLKGDIDDIMNATYTVVEDEAKRQESNFEKRRFFIAPSTFGKIKVRLNGSVLPG